MLDPLGSILRNPNAERQAVDFRPIAGAKALVMVVLCLASAGCLSSDLAPLVLEAHEMHESLVTREFHEDSIRHVPFSVLGGNPYLSNDSDFVAAIARGGSQGKVVVVVWHDGVALDCWEAVNSVVAERLVAH